MDYSQKSATKVSFQVGGAASHTHPKQIQKVDVVGNKYLYVVGA